MSFYPIPAGIDNPAMLALFRFGQESQTGLTITAITLAHSPVEGTLLLFKNGLLLNPGVEYTITGGSVTLSGAAIAADDFVAYYHYRIS